MSGVRNGDFCPGIFVLDVGDCSGGVDVTREDVSAKSVGRTEASFDGDFVERLPVC